LERGDCGGKPESLSFPENKEMKTLWNIAGYLALIAFGAFFITLVLIEETWK